MDHLTCLSLDVETFKYLGSHKQSTVICFYVCPLERWTWGGPPAARVQGRPHCRA